MDRSIKVGGVIRDHFLKELRELYNHQPLTVDKLPYSDEFEEIYNGVRSYGISRQELYCILLQERKACRLKGKRGFSPKE